MPAFDTDKLRRDNPLSEYLPSRGIGLSPDGHEWRACCPFHAEKTPSFTVRVGRKGTQEYHCFGCPEAGDVLDFVQRYDGVGFTEACEILGGTRTTDPARVPASTSIERMDIYAAWKARMPDASTPPIIAGKRTPPLANPKRPEKPVTHYTPTAVYPYHRSDGRVVGYVLRVDIKGKKITPLILWCENTETGELTWCHRPFAAPRPLYNLPAFAARPDAQVLVVEGEKTAEAAQRLLPKAVATCWQGGAKAAGKSDWSPVSGRDVLIWPDADPEGETAAQEAASLAQAAGASRVRIVRPPADAEKGWDLADAEAEGWTRADVVAHARAGAQEPGQPRRTPDPEPQPPGDDERRFDVPPADRDGERSNGPTTKPALKSVEQEKPQEGEEHKPEPRQKFEPKIVAGTAVRPAPDLARHWKADLQLDQNNNPVKKLTHNVAVFLRSHPDMEGAIARDEFSGQVFFLRPPPWERGNPDWEPHTVGTHDITAMLTWTDRARLGASSTMIRDAVGLVAHENRFDPVRDYLLSLRWDGVKRLEGDETRKGWLERYLGARPTPSGIHNVFGAKTLVAVVARNLTNNRGGEKADTMLILEGAQGLGKSQAIKILGTPNGNDEWFTHNLPDLSSKDSQQKMQGKILIEVDELAAFSGSSTDKLKAVLSTQKDSLRLPYTKDVENYRRRFMFIGTMNPRGMGYLPDSTGNRRYWPVFVDGPFDLDALMCDRDQLWAEAVMLYQAGEQWHLTPEETVAAQVEQAKRFQADPWADDLDDWLDTIVGTDTVTLTQAFQRLNLATHLRNSDNQNRIVNHLTARGWKRTKDKKHGGQKTVFRRPQE